MLPSMFRFLAAPYTEVFTMNSRTNEAGISEKKTLSFASFTGVDLHKCTVTLVAVDAQGKVIAKLTTSTKCIDKIQAWLEALPRPSSMAVEAVCFVEWFIDRYRTCVDRIDIADATELSNRRGKRRKTDRNDALDIAVRLARGDCPLGFIADEPLMQLRKLGRHWRQLSLTLSRTKQYMRSILLAANIRGPKLDGASAQRWFLAHGGLLKDVQRKAFTNFTDIILLIERQRESLKRQIIMANRSEEFEVRIAILKSIPGIDEIWSCIIAAEVGPFDRFPNADALEFWAGMTADLKESAGRTTSGKITKAGSAVLRWALCKAAMTLCRSDADPESIRQKLIKRIGKPKANVAMGRRLLRTIYAMMRDWTFYQVGQRTNHLAAANRARAKKRKTKKEAA
jgi:transposase